MTILGPVAINRLAAYAEADMTDQATRDNVQRFAFEALPDLIETVRFWMGAWEGLNELYLAELQQPTGQAMQGPAGGTARPSPGQTGN